MNDNWVIEIKGPNGIKQVELTNERVTAHKSHSRVIDYTKAAWLAFIKLMEDEHGGN